MRNLLKTLGSPVKTLDETTPVLVETFVEKGRFLGTCYNLICPVKIVGKDKL